MEVILCQETGFCVGVRHALSVTNELLEHGVKPICILHDLVHNEFVVRELIARGVRIVDSPYGLEPGTTLIFSAHGVSESTEAEARSLPLHVIDATCPLVKQVHQYGRSLSEEGYVVLLFGKEGHREVEGILGRIPGEKILLRSLEDAQSFIPDHRKKYACISQTTFNNKTLEQMKRVLAEKIPSLLSSHAKVCHSTAARQNAVCSLARKCDLVVIVGSSESSNTRRLCEISEDAGTRAILVTSPDDLTLETCRDAKCVGVASGASAPDDLVSKVYEKLLSFAKIKTQKKSTD